MTCVKVLIVFFKKKHGKQKHGISHVKTSALIFSFLKILKILKIFFKIYNLQNIRVFSKDSYFRLFYRQSEALDIYFQLNSKTNKNK